MKVYGFKPIVEKFVAEIKCLQDVAFQMNLPILGPTTVYACLGKVACDNLALNSMLGFVECFSCDFFCTICYATQEEIRNFFEVICSNTEALLIMMLT